VFAQELTMEMGFHLIKDATEQLATPTCIAIRPPQARGSEVNKQEKVSAARMLYLEPELELPDPWVTGIESRLHLGSGNNTATGYICRNRME